jgi:hypothetical protein
MKRYLQSVVVALALIAIFLPGASRANAQPVTVTYRVATPREAFFPDVVVDRGLSTEHLTQNPRALEYVGRLRNALLPDGTRVSYPDVQSVRGNGQIGGTVLAGTWIYWTTFGPPQMQTFPSRAGALDFCNQDLFDQGHAVHTTSGAWRRINRANRLWHVFEPGPVVAAP